MPHLTDYQALHACGFRPAHARSIVARAEAGVDYALAQIAFARAKLVADAARFAGAVA